MRNRFQKMSGCYTCVNCGKKTRDTGHGEAQVELCKDCLIEAENENSHNDNGHPGNFKDCPLCHPSSSKQNLREQEESKMKEITKDEFLRYEEVRVSGVTNMFDTRTVEKFSGLEKERIIAIIHNYTELKKKYLPDGK